MRLGESRSEACSFFSACTGEAYKQVVKLTLSRGAGGWR